MKINCLLDNIKNAIILTERISAKNQTLQILSSVFIGTEKDKIKIRSTNLEMALETEIPGKILEPGNIVVPAKALGLFLSNISDNQVTMESKRNNFYIKTKTTETTILGYPPEDFPLFPKIEIIDKFKVSGFDIANAISLVILAISSSDTKPELSSMFFSVFKNTITVAATDSYRLAEKKIISKEFYSEKQIIFLVPQKTIHEILRLLEKYNGDVDFYLNKNQLTLLFKGIKFISRLTNGLFPEYDQIIPKTFKTTAIVKKSDFLSGIKLSSIFSGKLGDVSISFQPQNHGIFISTSNQESGDHSSFIEAVIQGDETNLKFNWRYLYDGAMEINNEYIVFQLNTEQSPLFMKGKGDNSYFYIAMPMRGV